MIVSSSKRLQAALNEATTYEEWKAAAIAYDKKTGLDRWKSTDESEFFDFASIRRRLKRLRKLRAADDHAGLLFALNEGIHGNIDGMGRNELYGKAKFGTKRLISDYVDEITATLELLASDAANDIPFDERLDFFRRARRCYGCSALMMSGAGSLLFFHIGVVKAIASQGLLPDILSGSSGGAFVSAIVSTHGDHELEEIFAPENLVPEIEREQGFVKYLNALSPEVAKTEEVYGVLERMIPDLTFQEAYERVRRKLNVSVAAAEKHQTSRLLNSITTPNVFVRDAVMASMAIPGIYPPVALRAKNYLGEKQAYMPSRKWVDGSISDDLPAKRLTRLYGVNHFIVSQTNPHVFPFVTDTSREPGVLSTLRHASRRTAREWINASAAILEKPLEVSPALSKVTNMALGVINQDYIGDINILPDKRFFNPLKLLAFKTVEEVIALIGMGERATWPKIEMIRIQTKIGHALDDILANFDRDLSRLRSRSGSSGAGKRKTRKRAARKRAV